MYKYAHPLLYMITTNRSSVRTSIYARVKQGGSFVSESWSIAQTIVLPHPFDGITNWFWQISGMTKIGAGIMDGNIAVPPHV